MIKIGDEILPEIYKEKPEYSGSGSMKNCLKLMAEIKLKKKKNNQINFQAHPITEYLRNELAEKSETYLYCCINALPKYKEQADLTIKNALNARSISTNTQLLIYSLRNFEN